jgi:hypothetical protein
MMKEFNVMTDTTLDIMRADAFFRRVKGSMAGNRIEWSAKDIAMIRDHIAAIARSDHSRRANGRAQEKGSIQ